MTSAGDQPLRGEDFREYTASELAESLHTAGLPGDPVEIEIQDSDGNVIAGGLVRLHVGHGHDFDRVATYTWTKITARQEPAAAHTAGIPAGVAELLAELTGGRPAELAGEPGDYLSVSRPSDSPDWQRLAAVVAQVEAWKAARVPAESVMRDLFDVYAVAYLAANKAGMNIPGRFTEPGDRRAAAELMANGWLEGFLFGVLFSQAGGHREQDGGS